MFAVALLTVAISIFAYVIDNGCHHLFYPTGPDLRIISLFARFDKFGAYMAQAWALLFKTFKEIAARFILKDVSNPWRHGAITSGYLVWNWRYRRFIGTWFWCDAATCSRNELFCSGTTAAPWMLGLLIIHTLEAITLFGDEWRLFLRISDRIWAISLSNRVLQGGRFKGLYKRKMLQHSSLCASHGLEFTG